MISITTISFDPVGHVMINNIVNTGALVHERRSSKAATLDGFSTISDFGYTASDNVFTVKITNPPQSTLDRLIYLIKNYPLLRYVNYDGVFIGSLTKLRLDLHPIEFTFDVKKQVI